MQQPTTSHPDTHTKGKTAQLSPNAARAWLQRPERDRAAGNNKNGVRQCRATEAPHMHPLNILLPPMKCPDTRSPCSEKTQKLCQQLQQHSQPKMVDACSADPPSRQAAEHNPQYPQESAATSYLGKSTAAEQVACRLDYLSCCVAHLAVAPTALDHRKTAALLARIKDKSNLA